MNLRTHGRLFLAAVLLLISLAGRSRAADAANAAAPPVLISDVATTATLANGVVSLTVSKANANLLSLRSGGKELLSRGGGYWNIYGKTPGQKNTQEKPTPSVFRVTRDSSQTRGELGEIAILFPYKGQPDAVPMDFEIRYTLHCGDRGIHGWTIADHAPQYPPFNVEVCTFCLKMNPDLFDFLSVDARRQRLMATSEDWVKGTQLNLWEVRRLNTGVRKLSRSPGDAPSRSSPSQPRGGAN